MILPNGRLATAIHAHRRRWVWPFAEFLLIWLVFFWQAGWPAPEVNEAHYLAKAKHFWDNQWCSGDLFLESANVHQTFAWVIGWTTLFLSLPTVAWLGRLLTWGLLACAWQRLCGTVVPRAGLGFLSAGLVVGLWQHGHMSGEWVVGGLEAKGLAYACNFFALVALLQNRYGVAWLLFGIAVSFHALVGGWAFLAGGFVYASSRWSHEHDTRLHGLALLGGIALAGLGLWPALTMNMGVDLATVQQAEVVYVYQRLSHHLVFHRFPSPLVARHFALLGVWAVLACRLRHLAQYRQLTRFAWASVFLSLIGILLDHALPTQAAISAHWLRFYWFRLADAMVPVAVAIGFVAWIESQRIARPARYAWLLLGALSIVSLQLGYRSWERSPYRIASTSRYDRSPRWRSVCRWIAANTPREACIFTPVGQHTFKWYAERSEVVTWKDIPQNASAVVDWWTRLQRARGVRERLHDAPELVFPAIQQLARDYNFEYVIVTGLSPSPTWCGQPVIHAQEGYLVVRLMESPGHGTQSLAQ